MIEIIDNFLPKKFADNIENLESGGEDYLNKVEVIMDDLISSPKWIIEKLSVSFEEIESNLENNKINKAFKKLKIIKRELNQAGKLFLQSSQLWTMRNKEDYEKVNIKLEELLQLLRKVYRFRDANKDSRVRYVRDLKTSLESLQVLFENCRR